MALALGSNSFAQTNAPQAAAPAKLALAREVIRAMQAGKMFDGMAVE